jgi:predicted short-subunit dehydrogenase-like oxidoreductase (DUF2520 family)
MQISFIGAGRIATSLALAWSRQGAEVTAVASRSAPSAQRIASMIPGCRAVDAAEAAAADIVFITTPDDQIGPVCASLAWREGQAVVHCSGATEVSVLEPAARAGALIGGFHPLQIFSDPMKAVDLLEGSYAAIEGPPALDVQLRRLAERLQMRVLGLPPGARPRYHAGGGFAASSMIAMLREAVDVWGSFGVSEQDALQALLPLARGTLATVASKGSLAASLAGPVSRGDAGVVSRHLDALDALGETHGAFYRQLLVRQLELARESGRLDRVQVEALQRAIDAT